MKKISFVLLAFVLVVFTQCKKSKDTESSQSEKVEIRAYASTNNSKTQIDANGTVKWTVGDKFRFFDTEVVRSLNAGFVQGNLDPVTRISMSGLCVMKQCYYGEDFGWRYPTDILRDFVYVGENAVVGTDNITLSFAGQSGTSDNIGKTHYMRSNPGREGKRMQNTSGSWIYEFDNVGFTTRNAIARFDLSGVSAPVNIYYEYTEGVAAQCPVQVTLTKGEERLAQKEGTLFYQIIGLNESLTRGSCISIATPSEDTYVALMPDHQQLGKAVTLIFKKVGGGAEEEIGRVTLPNVLYNHMYTGPNFAPITLETGKGAKSVVVATEM